jgi:hypothetical protein
MTKFYDCYSRVTMMTQPSLTWDLSPNDIEALRCVLVMVNVLADRVAHEEQINRESVLKKYGELLDDIQIDWERQKKEAALRAKDLVGV